MSIHHELHRARRLRERSIVTLALFAILAFTTVCGIVLAVLFLPNPSLLFGGQTSGLPSNRIEEIEIGGVLLHVPESLIARIDRTLLRDVERLDVAIPWPTAADAAAPPAADRLVMLTLTPAKAEKTHEDLLEPIYRVYFADRQAPREGLRTHRFAAGAPYADSEIVVDYRETPPVAMRCDLKPSVLGPVLCDRLLRAGGGVAARLRFARGLAEEWKAIDGAVRALLEEMTRSR